MPHLAIVKAHKLLNNGSLFGELRELILCPFESSRDIGRITSMEGMRGYAVLLVFLVHHGTLFGARLPPGFLREISQSCHNIGHSGVDLFFVISGFLIYGHLLRKAPGYLDFMRRRLRRLYPTFFAVFCLYVLLSHLLPAVSKIPGTPFEEMGYLAKNLAFLPGIVSGVTPLITVAWSLSYEFLFYASIPLIVSLPRARTWTPSVRICFFLTGLAAAWIASALGLLPQVRMCFFGVGILLYEATEDSRLRGLGTTRNESIVILVYLSTLGWLAVGSPDTDSPCRAILLSAALFGLTFVSFTFGGRIAGFFAFAPFRWLGNISYSFFLIHGLVLNGVAFFMRKMPLSATISPAAFACLILMNLVLSLSAAFVLFVVVERPLSLRSAPLFRQGITTSPVPGALAVE